MENENYYGNLYYSLKKDSGFSDNKLVDAVEKEDNYYANLLDKTNDEKNKQDIKAGKDVPLQETTFFNKIGRLTKNVLPNGAKYGTDIGKALWDFTASIFNPTEDNNLILTGEGLLSLAKGGLKTSVGKGIDISLANYEKNYKKEDLKKIPEYNKLLSAKEKIETSRDTALFGEYYKNEIYNNFGTWKNFENAMIEKPVETTAKVAELFIASSKVIRGTGVASTVDKALETSNYGKFASYANVEKTLKQASDIVTNAIDPINVATKGVKILNPFKNYFNPEMLHSKALELFNKFDDKRMAKIVETSIKDNLSINDKSIDLLRNQISDLESTKKFTLKALSDPKNGIGSAQLNPEALFSDLDTFIEDRLGDSPMGIKVKEMSDSFKNDIREANEYLGRKNITPDQVNKYKVRINKELDKFYDKIVVAAYDAPLKDEMKSIIGKTAEKFLEDIVPEFQLNRFNKVTKDVLQKMYPDVELKGISLKQLNEIEGNLIELRKEIKKTSAAMKNGSIVPGGIGQKAYVVKGIVGAGLGGLASMFGADPGTVKLLGTLGFTGGAALGLIDSSPNIKMKLGNFLNSMRKAGIATTPNAALIRLGLYETDKVNEMMKGKLIESEQVETTPSTSPLQP